MLTYAIRTARSQHSGYEVYCVADKAVLATFATYGEASRYHGTLPCPTIHDYLRAWRDQKCAEPNPSPDLLAALDRVEALLAEEVAA